MTKDALILRPQLGTPSIPCQASIVERSQQRGLLPPPAARCCCLPRPLHAACPLCCCACLWKLCYVKHKRLLFSRCGKFSKQSSRKAEAKPTRPSLRCTLKRTKPASASPPLCLGANPSTSSVFDSQARLFSLVLVYLPLFFCSSFRSKERWCRDGANMPSWWKPPMLRFMLKPPQKRPQKRW